MLLDEYGVEVSGPLAPWARGFASALTSLGYVRPSVRRWLFVFAFVSRWLDDRRFRPAALTPVRLRRLRRARRGGSYRLGLSAVLRFLWAEGVVPTAADRVVARTSLDRLLGRYRDYLVEERGLSAGVVHWYSVLARRFLQDRAKSSLLRRLTAHDVRGFLLKEARGFSTGYATSVASALRSVLRYLHVDGRIPAALVSAVPSISGWRLASLPQALTSGTVRKLLRSCDRRKLIGRRDFAIIVLLARLGLRRGEVVLLEIDDLDWRNGEIVVRGKGKTVSRLPMPEDVGRALSAYLVRRPRVASRAVFLRSRAPLRPLTTTGVLHLVAQASRRAGLPLVSPHRLRHTVATEILRRGGSLAEIAQVLRHRSLATTAIYAKVDRTALRDLAQPWPGGVA